MHFSDQKLATKDSRYEKEALREALLVALADVVTLSFRAQSFHWNVEGPEFHQYHEFFGVIYEDIEESIDPIAENLLKAGFKAPSSISEIISKTSLECPPCGSDPVSMSKMLYKANRATLVSLNKVFEHAETMNLQGLVDFIGGRIDMHEKWSWQLKSIVGPMMDDVDEIPMKKVVQGPVVEEMVFQAEDKSCPPATLDIELNLKNRKTAIDSAMYGPLNPAEPNDEYWQELADEWNVEADTARKQTCGNCAMFNISSEMKACIADGVGPDRFDQVDAAGELGYCEAFDFKCASARTCRAWVGGGPITAAALVPEEQALADALREVTDRYGKFNQDETGVWAGYTPAEENKDAEIGVTCANCVFYGGGNNCEIIALDVEPQGKCRFAVIPDGVVQVDEKPERDFNPEDVIVAAAGDPCWEGYVQVGMKEKDGKMVPNCVPADSSAAQEFARKSGASTPAPKKDQIKGSDKNPKGSASGGKKITFSESVEKSLRNKVEEHNEKAPAGRKATISMLKAVYRRGAGAYSTSHRPGKSRGQWAMARVNAFLRLLSSGKPSNPAYTQDNDLLPAKHPKSTKSSSSNHDEYVESQLELSLLPSARDYESVSDAIIAAVEASGFGYDAEQAFKAAWMRALDSNEDPYSRVVSLAQEGFSSRDADLLPVEDIADE